MKHLRIIDSITLDEFVKTNFYNHYKKTSYWVNHESNPKTIPHYLGYFYEDTLIGTALLIETKSLFGRYIYIPQGPCIDYQDIESSKDFLEKIISFGKERNVLFLRMDPNVIRVSRDILGNQTDEINQEYITSYLKEIGFVHKGYGYAYNGSWSNRFTLAIDISKEIDEIILNFNKSKQNALKRQERIGVKTRIASTDDLVHLMNFEKELASILKFKPHSKEFFLKYLNEFKSHAHLYVTELYVNELIREIEAEIDSGKYKKDKEALASKEKELNEARKWKKSYGEIIPIAAGLFLHYGFKSWDLYTYSRKEFNSMKPTDNLHLFAISDLKKHHVSFYDMCGFSGTVDKNDSYYGLYDYKKSFGSQYIEYIGEFDYIYKPNKFKYYLLIAKIKSRLKFYFKKIKIR